MGALLPVLAGIFEVLLLGGMLRLVRAWRRRRRRTLAEDALKQIYGATLEGRSLTSADIAGRLGLSRGAMLQLAGELEAAGLTRSRGDLLEPTEAGADLGRHVLRGHRLWERYLADEARLPIHRLHGAAEHAEHDLSTADVESLADHLGHPAVDPHGDPIPAAVGERATLAHWPLADWPCGRLAVIVHVEDEPRQGLQAALAAGLRPGTVLRVLERNAEAVVCETAGGRCALAPAVAARIDVLAAADDARLEAPPLSLAGLALGAEAEVAGLSAHCTGLGRRRLLDLGFTAGTPVKAVLTNMGGAAHAYRIRGTTIALRREQAEEVLIRSPLTPALPTELERKNRS